MIFEYIIFALDLTYKSLAVINNLRLMMLSLIASRNILIKSNNVIRTICTSRILNNTRQEDARLQFREVNKDRSQLIPVETSLKYMKSAAYKQTYGEQAVWVQYRRNHKGSIPPRKTRKTCIRGDRIATGSPCPICRDEYLVLHEENIALLQQFICPHTGSVLSYSQTGLCQKSHQKLVVAIERAKDKGLITYDVPIRHYDYAEYYNPNSK